jgi:SRSO17 transposase
MLFITRERQSDGTLKHDYYLSNADPDTPAIEFARAAKAEHRIEECFQRGKSEAGLGDYQVRNWIGWHHHQTLSLIAAWFLNEETRRGKNTDPRDDRPPSPPPDRLPDRTPTPIAHADAHRRHHPTLAPTKRTRPCRSLRSP